MPELRVAIDARLRTGEAGGVESVVVGLASALSALADGEETYYFLCHDDSADWLEPFISGAGQLLRVSRAASKVDRTNTARRAIRDRFPAARRAWRRRPVLPFEPIPGPPPSDDTIEAAGIQVMHFTTQAGFLTRIPSIYHPHDLQHVHLPEFFSARERALRERRYRTLCEQAELVVVTSEWTRRDVISHYRLAPDKVHVIPWAPATAAYRRPTSEELQDLRTRHRLPARFVFYPAQTWPHKNHVALLEAIAEIRADGDGLAIPVVFSGTRNTYAIEIDRRIERLGLEDLVTWVGFVPTHDLIGLYELSRAVVIPSRFEAASGPLWEAFRAGIPAAAARVTSIPDQAGDAALLFDPDDINGLASVIRRLWTDDALCDDLRRRGLANVSRFSWDRTARTFRAEYRRLAGRSLSGEDRELLAATSPI